MDERTGGPGGGGGTDPSDAEAVRRIREGAGAENRAAVKAAEKALREFQERHYAAVFALARVYCGSSQAAANLAAEAFTRALGDPANDDAAANWRARLLAAVSGTAESWYQRGRRNELREDFQPWRAPAQRPEEVPGTAPAPRAVGGAGAAPGAVSEETVVIDPAALAGVSLPTVTPAPAPAVAPVPAPAPWAEPLVERVSEPGTGPVPGRVRSLAGLSMRVGSLDGPVTRHRRFPSRVVLPAVAFAVLCGAAVAGIPLLQNALHKNPTGSVRMSPTPSASRPAPSSSPVAPGGGPPIASASASASVGSPRATSAAPGASASATARATATPTAMASTTHAIALSDLRWASAVNGEGPVERDRSNGGRAAGDGQPLSIRGVGYRKGLGVSAPSDITYGLGGACTSLQVDVGIDDEAGAGGSVVFVVYRDDTQVASSGTVTGADPAVHLSADLTGGSVLRLVVVDGGGNGQDHGDWAAPRLTCN